MFFCNYLLFITRLTERKITKHFSITTLKIFTFRILTSEMKYFFEFLFNKKYILVYEVDLQIDVKSIFFRIVLVLQKVN